MSMQTKSPGGFSLVEVMVAMAIALIGTVIIFQVFSVSESIKRTSTSGGDAQQFGALGLYTMERELRMAGLGINNQNLIGCTLRSYDNLGTPQVVPTYSLVPVQIVAGATAKDPDQITITYGNSPLLSSSINVTQNMTDASSIVRVSNRFGIATNNMLVLAETGKDCTMIQVTDLPATTGNTDQVIHDASVGQYNNPDVSWPAYTTNAMVFNMGGLPSRKTYGISNSELTVSATYSTAGAVAVADNIVMLKAQYGHDDGVDNGTVSNASYSIGDGQVDNYTNVMPSAPTAFDWLRVLSVRMALVARSALPEKPKVQGGPCDATTSAPTWSGGSFDLSSDANWQCYRYRVFETTVPLRNMIWQQL
ncbi:MAG TPA: PilW family protein [Burkholderiales bacterium]|nr:PilW family protein [Burkholderiales bacterium]